MRDTGPILVPLDGSEQSEKVLPHAAAFARALSAPVVLLTVWEGADSELTASFPAMSAEIAQQAQTHFTGYLDGVRGRVSDVPKVETSLRSGDAPKEIMAAIEETGARAVAIATHGRSGIGRWLYGSTAGHLLRHAPVPVLAVGPHVVAAPAREATHIMVALDGSKLSERALPIALMLASKSGARTSLVRAVPWAAQAYPYTLPDAYIPQIDDELEAGARAYLQGMQRSLPDAEVSSFIVRGPAADGLMEFVESESVDLVVMTTHARTGLLRTALGSVADRMLQAKAPVLLISPDDDGG